MTKKAWTPEREAAVVRRAEDGFAPSDIGPARPNPLRKSGRPSLSPEGGESKVLNARIPSSLHSAVQSLADRTGRSTSDLTRAALDVFVSSAAPAQRARGRYRAATRPPRVCLIAPCGAERLAAVRKHLATLGLDVVVLDEERRPRVSPPLHVLGAHLAASDAVLVLLTAESGDDRRGILFELGYALALLDHDRVVVLHDLTADIPADLAGGILVDVTKPRFLSAVTRHLASRGLVVRADAG